MEHTSREIAVGDIRLTLDADVMSAMDGSSRELKWKARSPDGRSLGWVNSSAQTAYLFGYRTSTRPWETPWPEPPEVRRLDLGAGTWLPPLAIPAPASMPSEQKDRRIGIIDVVPSDDRVIVLSADYDRQDGWGQHHTLGYGLACFGASDAQLRWHREFASNGSLPSPGAFLLSSGGPTKARPAVAALTRMGGSLLVCPGPVEDLRCISVDTGAELWTLPRVWEYQRGFIGPSVWQHYLTRFGQGGFVAQDAEDAAQRASFDQRFTCFFVGGPAVAHSSGEDNAIVQRIFLAVAKSPADPFAEYLADSFIYEVGADGRPISVAQLPQLVRGSEWTACDDGVFWACESESFVKLRASSWSTEAEMLDMGPFGFDRITHVESFRRLSFVQPGAWLTAGKAGDPVAMNSQVAFRLPAGGFVADSSVPVYEFPISLIIPKDGAVSDFLLNVPFNGTLSPPDCNYSRTTSSGREQISSMGPHGLAITALALDGDRLRIRLGVVDDAFELEFDAAALMRK